MKCLLIIGTCLGLASCTPNRTIVHEIHYTPSYGALSPIVEPVERINPNMPSQAIENHRQYPPRGERNRQNDRDYPRGA